MLYHYDDKWVAGHRCKPSLHLLIVDDEGDTPTPSSLPDDLPDQLLPHVSMNALAGLLAPKTFRIYGAVNHHRVVILVDSGNTHNFIQTRVARFLNLKHSPTNPLQVMVGNGNVFECDFVCPSISLVIQGHLFPMDLFNLPITGTDIVLGIQWLKALEAVTTDYSYLTMTFSYLGQLVTLNANVPLLIAPASAQ